MQWKDHKLYLKSFILKALVNDVWIFLRAFNCPSWNMTVRNILLSYVASYQWSSFHNCWKFTWHIRLRSCSYAWRAPWPYDPGKLRSCRFVIFPATESWIIKVAVWNDRKKDFFLYSSSKRELCYCTRCGHTTISDYLRQQNNNNNS